MPPIERQRWANASTLPQVNSRLQRVVEVLDESARYDVRTIAANALLALTYPVTLCVVDTTAGNVTLTLPPARSVLGFRIEVKKTVAANTLTLDGAGSETIDGAVTLSWTAQYQSYSLVSDGSRWHVV